MSGCLQIFGRQRGLAFPDPHFASAHWRQLCRAPVTPCPSYSFHLFSRGCSTLRPTSLARGYHSERCKKRLWVWKSKEKGDEYRRGPPEKMVDSNRGRGRLDDAKWDGGKGHTTMRVISGRARRDTQCREGGWLQDGSRNGR